MTRGVRPPFRRWMDLSDQQSTCAKVSIESSPWTLVWCTAADGHRTYSAVRPMFSFEVVVVSCSVQRSFEVDLCMSPRARVSRNFARNLCPQSFLVWHVMPRQTSRGDNFPVSGTGTHALIPSRGVVLVATGDRMVATRMSHRIPSLFRDGCVHGWIPLLLVMHGRNDVEWV